MNSLHINVNLSFQQLIDVVKQLSPAEKLKLSDVIWSEHTDVPTEHQSLVLNRKQQTKKNPDQMLDWDEASKTLKP